MTTKEIINTQNNIYKFLFERRLKESFGLLSQLISVLQDWQITESLNEMETSYKYMIQYMLDGFNDPERKKIYDKLILSTYNLTDRVTDRLLERESSSLYYSHRRYINTQSENSLQKSFTEVDNAINNLSLNHLLDEQENCSEEQFKLKQDVEKYCNELFLNIWTNYPASEEDCTLIKNAILDKQFPETITSLIISALTLNLFHRYDERKLSILLEAYNIDSDEIRLRALCGALMALSMYNERISLSSAINLQIDSLKENPAFCSDTRNLFHGF